MIKITQEITGLLYYLINDGLLTKEQAQNITVDLPQTHLALTQYLTEKQILNSETIFNCCRKHFTLPVFDLNHFNPHYLQQMLIPTELIAKHRILPLNTDEHYLYLGITDPCNINTLNSIRFHCKLTIKPMLIAEHALEKIIQNHYLPKLFDSQIADFAKDMVDETIYPQQSFNEPIIQLVDHLIKEAIAKKASDIHIEPLEQYCRIRFRLDGLLHEIAQYPAHAAPLIATRLKVMSKLDIAESRLPQDGHITIYKMDIRLSTCPTLFGEKIVLRLLDKQTNQLQIDNLGFSEEQKKIFLKKIIQPQGLILVTGPTGSGKSMTLYAALHYLNQIEKNIFSAEDPIEIEIPGINQVNIHPKIGLDFVTILRAFLRQDPDIIMIGEIRDLETANIALQAAQTGHLVLSTLHTNSAAETLMRLQSMGVINYHLINSLSLIIAQRLVRTLCLHCKQFDNITQQYQARECEHCYQGYKGRTALFECLPITAAISEILLTTSKLNAIIDCMNQEKIILLAQSGLMKIAQGITTTTEINRVLIT